MTRVLLAGILIVGVVRDVSAFDAVSWMEALTFPASEWSAEDFGKRPSPEDRALLKRFKPKLFLSPGQSPPVDFYSFYLPKTVVRSKIKEGAVVLRSPGRAELKEMERNLDLYLDYVGPDAPCSGACSGYTPVGYGRVFREDLNLPGKQKAIPVTILKYNWVFLYSGLPGRLGWLRGVGGALLGDREKWHELDIHGAAQIILGPGEVPWALLLAQHNHFRSFVFGRDISFPENNTLSLCLAERSNEPYLCPNGGEPELHPTTGDPSKIRWILLGRSRPLASGRDLVRGPQGGAVAWDYDLKFLPTRDPLYVAWISLGDRGKIFFWDSWERSGPPGIDMNTLPRLKKYSDMLQFWYLRDGNEDDAAFMDQHMSSFFKVNFDPILKRNGSRLREALGPLVQEIEGRKAPVKKSDSR